MRKLRDATRWTHLFGDDLEHRREVLTHLGPRMLSAEERVEVYSDGAVVCATRYRFKPNKGNQNESADPKHPPDR